jgi:hypothetical protein
MKCSILQPHYLPWVGYFSMINNVDEFVFLDDVQFIKREWKNRNKIRKTKESEDYSWITVPIKKEFQKKNISECEIDYSYEWQKDHLNKIKNVYSKTLYFNEIYETILNTIHLKYNSLSELNISLIKLVMSYLEIDTKVIMSSTIKVDGQKDVKMLNISKKIKAQKILINKLSENYLDKTIFEKSNIEVIVQNFEEKKYVQYNNDVILDWIPKLSIIDVLFNCGKNSKNLL